MTIFRRGRIWHYDFWYRGERHRGSTEQLTKDDAEQFEDNLKRELRQRAAGIVPITGATPRFQDWAEVYYEHRARRVTRPQRIADVLRVVLRFWGARPSADSKVLVDPAAPYHDLRLGDVVADPYWIERFEQWMTARGVGPQTRNHYRSQLSMLYRVASLPKFRAKTRVQMNPFAGIERDRPVRRRIALTPDEVRRWLSAASYHVRLAVSIGALAPKLRLANILALRWDTHVDRQLQWITVHEHKTGSQSGEPLVIPISRQLRQILEDARRRNAGAFVVSYRGEPLQQIRDGIRGAAIRAGLKYGRDVGGLTFHTLRHTAATLMAELGLPEKIRAETMGHADIGTTQRYTHLRPVHLREPVERLSEQLPIADLVTDPRRRGGVGTFVREAAKTTDKRRKPAKTKKGRE